MKLIFLGPPGAGKGTLAALIAETYSLPHIATGEIFRKAISDKSPLGVKVQAMIDNGQLVGDELTVELVKERLAQEDVQNGFILDGFPRTIPQAEALEDILQCDWAVNFSVSDQLIIKRLSGRRICSQCKRNYHIEFMPPEKTGVCDSCGGELITRTEDRMDSISRRLEIYRSQTEPLIAHYRTKKILVDIDASSASGVVLERFQELFPRI